MRRCHSNSHLDSSTPLHLMVIWWYARYGGRSSLSPCSYQLTVARSTMTTRPDRNDLPTGDFQGWIHVVRAKVTFKGIAALHQSRLLPNAFVSPPRRMLPRRVAHEKHFRIYRFFYPALLLAQHSLLELESFGSAPSHPGPMRLTEARLIPPH